MNYTADVWIRNEALVRADICGTYAINSYGIILLGRTIQVGLINLYTNDIAEI